jgi:endonuclease/exonuclease/phosphatase (EEP) superfamily protein YafD
MKFVLFAVSLISLVLAHVYAEDSPAAAAAAVATGAPAEAPAATGEASKDAPTTAAPSSGNASNSSAVEHPDPVDSDQKQSAQEASKDVPKEAEVVATPPNAATSFVPHAALSVISAAVLAAFALRVTC